MLQVLLATSILNSCGSTQGFKKRAFQKETKKIARLFFVNQTRFIKKDHIWVVDSTENKKSLFTLVPTDGIRFEGKMPIEVHIKDSLLRKELLTPENIEHFNKQLKANEYNLLSKDLLKHPKVKMVTKEERPSGSFFFKNDVFSIKSIMFTKDMKYVIFYEYKANSSSGIVIMRKFNNKWHFYRSFMLSIS